MQKGRFWELFGKALWSFRLIILVVVIVMLLSSLIAFYLGIYSAYEAYSTITHSSPGHLPSEEILVFLISSIDEFLLGIVLIIIALGIYELFISDIKLTGKTTKWMEFSSLEELKAVLTKVIVIILMVYFFKSVVGMKFTTPLSILYLAIGVILIALANFITQKGFKGKNEKA